MPQEAGLLASLRHPNIVSFLGVVAVSGAGRPLLRVLPQTALCCQCCPCAADAPSQPLLASSESPGQETQQHLCLATGMLCAPLHRP